MFVNHFVLKILKLGERHITIDNVKTKGPMITYVRRVKEIIGKQTNQKVKIQHKEVSETGKEITLLKRNE